MAKSVKILSISPTKCFSLSILCGIVDPLSLSCGYFSAAPGILLWQLGEVLNPYSMVAISGIGCVSLDALTASVATVE